MSTTRIALVTASLFLASLAVGCAVDAEAMPEGSLSDNVAVTQTRTVSVPTQLDYVAPECQVRLVSTGPGPSIPNAYNPATCSAADPYKGQKRLAGYPESGMAGLVDEAKPGQLGCTKGTFGQLICKKSPDQMIEKLCTETRTYECPCGVVTYPIEGGTYAAACRNLPQ